MMYRATTAFHFTFELDVSGHSRWNVCTRDRFDFTACGKVRQIVKIKNYLFETLSSASLVVTSPSNVGLEIIYGKLAAKSIKPMYGRLFQKRTKFLTR